MRLLGGFYSQVKTIDMAKESSSSSSSGIDKAVEGEPIITWTCAVLKEFLRSQGGRLTGKKEDLVRRQIVHLVTKGWSVISTESLPGLSFAELSSVTKSPRLQRHWKSSVSGRLEADDKTTKSDDSARRGAPHAPTQLPSDGCTFANLHSGPSCQLYEISFFRGSVFISNKKKLSQFLLKKKWSGFVIKMSSSWNFFSEPFCEMHSVV